MKKHVIIFYLFFTISILSFGQSSGVGGFAGINIVPLEKQNISGQVFSMCYHLGAKGEYNLNKWFSLSAEISYTTSKKNFTLYDTTSFIQTISSNPFLTLTGININDILDSIGNFSTFINDKVYGQKRGITQLTYIHIPVLARFYYNSLSFSVGPYVGFKIKDVTNTEYKQQIPILDALTGFDTIPLFETIVQGSFPAYKQPITDQKKNDKEIRTIDYGFIVDLSYKITPDIYIGLRYSQGLNNYRRPEIRKNDFISSINVSIGYMLNFERETEAMFK